MGADEADNAQGGKRDDTNELYSVLKIADMKEKVKANDTVVGNKFDIAIAAKIWGLSKKRHSSVSLRVQITGTTNHDSIAQSKLYENEISLFPDACLQFRALVQELQSSIFPYRVGTVCSGRRQRVGEYISCLVIVKSRLHLDVYGRQLLRWDELRIEGADEAGDKM